MIHKYDSLTAAEASAENAKKKIKEFYIQVNLEEESSDLPSSEEVKEDKEGSFEIIAVFPSLLSVSCDRGASCFCGKRRRLGTGMASEESMWRCKLIRSNLVSV